MIGVVGLQLNLVVCSNVRLSQLDGFLSLAGSFSIIPSMLESRVG